MKSEASGRVVGVIRSIVMAAGVVVLVLVVLVLVVREVLVGLVVLVVLVEVEVAVLVELHESRGAEWVVGVSACMAGWLAGWLVGPCFIGGL